MTFVTLTFNLSWFNIHINIKKNEQQNFENFNMNKRFEEKFISNSAFSIKEKAELEYTLFNPFTNTLI